MIEAIILSHGKGELEQILKDVATVCDIAVHYVEISGTLPEKMEGAEKTAEREDGLLFFTEDPDAESVASLRGRVGSDGRAWLSLPPDEDAVHALAARCRDWVYEKGIVWLRIDSDVSPRHFPVCRDIVKALFAMCLLRTRPERLQHVLRARLPSEGGNPFPDMESVLRDLEAGLSLRDRVALAHFEGGYPDLTDSALAVYILGHYLWPPNPDLLKDCALVEGIPEDQMDDTIAVSMIIAALTEKLRQTHRLRVVPGGRNV
ncbi:hypothetical protein OOT00_05795 [Desulfobotulus sp. H1]|uniref:Uncharacterized protein n=1 Tax=Desulfobotulus pelophilus TaxID=2823377 RepID=A0ABT3N7R6_9BACT|nr:hypothetical protein [Desulfobotulus pelophilus]MCW7753499.1 hypothetical protein [Desulfobotulus pelophilus]